MRNKNTVIGLLLVFVAICAYNLYWTYQQYNIENQISPYREAANELTQDTASWGDNEYATLRAYDSIRTAMADERQKAAANSFTLGLDLQGGMYVTMQVQIEDIVRQLAGNIQDTSFTNALACARERRQAEATAYVPLFIDCYKTANPEAQLGVLFADPDQEIDFDTPDDQVQEFLEEKARDAMDRTFQIIRTRIDQFGVVSPNLQQLDNNRILLELPGVKDEDRVKRLLKQTAKMEFFTTHTVDRSYPVLFEINDYLKREQDAAAEATSTEDGEAETSADSGEEEGEEDDADADSTLASPDTASTDSAKAFEDMTEEERQAELEKYRAENPLFGLFAQTFDYNAMIANGVTEPLVARALEQDISRINAIFAREEIKNLIPPDMRFVWSYKPIDDETGSPTNLYDLITIKTNDDGTPAMGGDAVASARQDFNGRTGAPVVTMSMTSEGTKDWGQITEANIGKFVSVLLDNKVYSYPRVNDAIRSGSTEISGGFTIDEAKDLANVLEAGQLPVTTIIEGSQTVGPYLGEQNIKNGLSSLYYAGIVILIFMAVYYAKAGLVANVALIANAIFILGLSAAMTIVFTLPGLAALVLTIGMAVDANVLIFERIREELSRDKTLKASIKSGFANAFSSVMDANITTLLTGVVLVTFGVGPIRGFAVTLIIGIITSLISALIITRLILDYYGNKGSHAMNFGFDFTMGLFDKVKINMVGRRKFFYMVSGALVITSLILIGTVGFKTGVDFQGGRQYTVEFTQGSSDAATARDLDATEVNDLRGILTESFNKNAPQIKTLEADNQLLITTSYLVEDRNADSLVKSIMLTGIGDNYGDVSILSSTDVGPTVANDIKNAAYRSVVFSLIIIFLYILLRFRRWQYSLGAVVAVFHDVLIVLGVFSFLSMFDISLNVEIDQALIAALLTIIGYSINDTVVVFDRIRENLGEMKSSVLETIYNTSIDQTISRTLITSVTTFLTVLILYIFGGDVIRGFTFAILIGIIVGTYSSIFVASPISLDMINRSGGIQPVADEETKEKTKRPPANINKPKSKKKSRRS
ncbi:MAG: protein translocase subunit SecD [Bacteroidia bacterium]|nr:protein translocase subunit SecD [Bacteroidia bacterium]